MCQANKIDLTFRFRLKQQNSTFLWDGLKPSTTHGIERMLSAIENRISSLFTNLLSKTKQVSTLTIFQPNK